MERTNREDIHLHIERLVLDGFDLTSDQQDVLQSALTAELSRLLSAGGLNHSLALGGAYQEAPASPANLSVQTRPAEMGRQIARSVYGGLGV